MSQSNNGSRFLGVAVLSVKKIDKSNDLSCMQKCYWLLLNWNVNLNKQALTTQCIILFERHYIAWKQTYQNQQKHQIPNIYSLVIKVYGSDDMKWKSN